MLTTRECDDLSVLPMVVGVIQRAFAQQEGRVDPPQGALRETAASLEEKLGRETLFVAELDGALAGCAWCRPDGDDGAYVGRIAVEPVLQGRGIGRQLLRHAIDWAHGRGAARVRLEVRIELTENVAFFERRGFVITESASHPEYDRPTYYRMELRL